MFPLIILRLVLMTSAALQGSGQRVSYEAVRRPIHTPGTSPWHLLPTWESSLSVFGVQADGDVHIKFISTVDDNHVVISLNVTKYEGESQMTVNIGDSATTQVSRNNVSLSPNKYTWFSTFRKESTFALMKGGAVKPLLMYTSKAADVDFMLCNVFQVWSRGKATWDFRGEKYLGVTPGTIPTQPALVAEVRGAVRGVAERMLAIDFFLDHTHVPALPRHAQVQLAETLDDLNPFFLMFRFHAFDFFRHLIFIPKNNIQRVRNELSTILRAGRKAK